MSIDASNEDKAIYAYPDILNGIEHCLMNADYPDFMTLSNNADKYLFPSIGACCQEYEYACSSKSTSAPSTITRPVYAYPDILHSIEHCLMDAYYPDFMTLPNNSDGYLFPNIQACCQEYGYSCNNEPKPPPSINTRPTESLTSNLTNVPSEETLIATLLPETASREEDIDSLIASAGVQSVPKEMSNPPTLSPSTKSSTIMDSYLLDSGLETNYESVNDNSNADPLIFLYILVPMVVLVVASMYYRSTRKREAAAAAEEDELLDEVASAYTGHDPEFDAMTENDEEEIVADDQSEPRCT